MPHPSGFEGGCLSCFFHSLGLVLQSTGSIGTRPGWSFGGWQALKDGRRRRKVRERIEVPQSRFLRLGPVFLISPLFPFSPPITRHYVHKPGSPSNPQSLLSTLAKARSRLSCLPLRTFHGKIPHVSVLQPRLFRAPTHRVPSSSAQPLPTPLQASPPPVFSRATCSKT